MKIQIADEAFWIWLKIKYRKARFSWQRARFFYALVYRKLPKLQEEIGNKRRK